MKSANLNRRRKRDANTAATPDELAFVKAVKCFTVLHHIDVDDPSSILAAPLTEDYDEAKRFDTLKGRNEGLARELDSVLNDHWRGDRVTEAEGLEGMVSQRDRLVRKHDNSITAFLRTSFRRHRGISDKHLCTAYGPRVPYRYLVSRLRMNLRMTNVAQNLRSCGSNSDRTKKRACTQFFHQFFEDIRTSRQVSKICSTRLS